MFSLPLYLSDIFVILRTPLTLTIFCSKEMKLLW